MAIALLVGRQIGLLATDALRIERRRAHNSRRSQSPSAMRSHGDQARRVQLLRLGASALNGSRGHQRHRDSLASTSGDRQTHLLLCRKTPEAYSQNMQCKTSTTNDCPQSSTVISCAQIRNSILHRSVFNSDNRPSIFFDNKFMMLDTNFPLGQQKYTDLAFQSFRRCQLERIDRMSNKRIHAPHVGPSSHTP